MRSHLALLAFALAFLFALTAASNHTNTLQLNDACNTTSATPNNGCAFGLTCIDSICATDNIDASCTNNSVPGCYANPTHIALLPGASIFGSPVVQCVNKTCGYISGLGDFCGTGIANCAKGTTCSDGVCVGVQLNQTCGLESQCGYGLICSQDVCVNAPTNTSCINDGCYPGHSCLANNTCIEDYTLDEGDNCSLKGGATNSPFSVCKVGYTCFPGNNTCVSAVIVPSSCKVDGDCDTHQSCIFSVYSNSSFCGMKDTIGAPQLDPCGYFESFLQPCMLKYNCTTAMDTPNSCVHKHCRGDYSSSMSCQCHADSDIYSTSFYNEYCPSFPVWGILFIVLGILILLYIALIIFLFIKNRNKASFEAI